MPGLQELHFDIPANELGQIGRPNGIPRFVQWTPGPASRLHIHFLWDLKAQHTVLTDFVISHWQPLPRSPVSVSFNRYIVWTKSNEDGWRPSVGCAGAGWEETKNNLKRVKVIDFEGAFQRYQKSLAASRLNR
jgi:hypothetical protein